ncbi:MAG TPA: DUF4253 domain-containing protein [Candidatus Fournierella pullicola]|uniref:DUF4253 domain-containing protein n=1 Tax=Candidatus Allofournierella pullicola TaxID=2838596 RepID=A0A9D1V287_9FIRM|nr:DUF4253 domain-containing protein [Candidatus Fournierella pullicola]
MDFDFIRSQCVGKAMMNYLGCSCTFFEPMDDDDPIMDAYHRARQEGSREGFVPVLVTVDKILWECLVMNSSPGCAGRGDYAFDPEKVALYRRQALAVSLENSDAVLKEMAGRHKQDQPGLDGCQPGSGGGGEANDAFGSYWNPFTRKTFPLILANVPVKNPWEIFAYLPFGGWNECPDTPQLMAAAKCWFERFGAVPAVMTRDTLEFELPAPVPGEQALELAQEQHGFCPDMDQGGAWSLAALADDLRRSTVWRFWWD